MVSLMRVAVRLAAVAGLLAFPALVPSVVTPTVASASVAACSPTTSTSGTYTVLSFTAVGTCNWTPPAANLSMDYLIVAGGGGGGVGGGGGGGLRAGSTTLSGSTVQTIVVGGGGAGGSTGGKLNSGATNGGNSSALGVTADGGGAGGGYGEAGSAGGSGGGGGGDRLSGGGSAVAGQGSAGGSAAASGYSGGGGGGGAGAAGGNSTTDGSTVPVKGGAGGDGLSSSITGVSPAPYYAGGGGGGVEGTVCRPSSGAGGQGGGGRGSPCRGSAPLDGTASTGGGGGGAENQSTHGGNGGSGIVILRYLTADVPPPCLAGSGNPATLLDAATCTPDAAYLGVPGVNLAWVKMTTSSNIWVTGLKAFRQQTGGGTLSVRLEGSTGTSLATAAWNGGAAPAGAQWVTHSLTTPVALAAGSTFWLGMQADYTQMYWGGTYPSTNIGPVSILGSEDGSNAAFPGPWAGTLGTTIPWVDLVFTTTAPATVPDAPTAVSAEAGDGSATVYFTPPANDGGSAITAYQVTASSGGPIATGSGSPLGISGLTNGTAYTFTVRAVNGVGLSAASAATSSVTPKAPQTISFGDPGPKAFGTTPTLTASASSDLAVTFSSSTTGVCRITSAGELEFATAGTCAITAVQAGNAAFLPAASVTREFTVNPVVPGAPLSVSADAGDGTATVSWAAPSSNGGASITGYTVTSSRGQTCTTSSARSCTVSGLANGLTHTFTVRATNSAGTGGASAASAAVTPTAPSSGGGGSAPEPARSQTPTPTPTPTPSASPATSAPASESAAPSAIASPTASGPASSAAPSATRSPLAPSATASSSASATATASPVRSATASPTATARVAAESAPTSIAPPGVDPGDGPTSGSGGEAVAAPPVPSGPVVEMPSGGLFSGQTSGPTVDLQVDVELGKPVAGASVRARGTNLQPGAPVEVIVYSEPRVLATTAADAAGNVDVVATLPDDLPPGPHSVVLRAIGPTGEPLQYMAGIEIGDGGVATAVAPAAEANGVEPDGEQMQRALAAGKPVYVAADNPVAVAAVATAGAAVVAVASTAGAAAAAGGAVGGASGTGGHGGGEGAGSRTAGHTSPESSEGHAHAHAFNGRGVNSAVRRGRALGDRSGTWRLPLTAEIEALVATLMARTGRFSLILPKALADGTWARAMFGSGAQVLWLLGIVLGAVSLGQAGFNVYPGSIAILLAIMALGILDAMAGVLAWATIFLGAFITGHVRSVEDLTTAVGIGGIAISLSFLANYMRPLRREPGTGAVYVFDRIADYVIPAVVIAFGAAGMANGLNALSGLTIITHEQTVAVEVVAGVAVLARLALEDIAVYLYPERCAAVAIQPTVHPSLAWRISAIVVRSMLTVLVLAAFIGMTPMAMLLTALLALPLLLRVWSERLPNSPTMRRFLPRGLVKVTLATVAGILIAGWIFGSPDLAAMTPWILGLLMLPSAILSVLDTFARSGGDWNNVWPKRLAGVGVWFLCVGLLSGAIVLAH